MAIKINADNIAKGYFNPRQPIGNLPVATKKTVEKISAAVVESYEKSHAPIEKLPEISVDEIAKAYKAAHGIA